MLVARSELRVRRLTSKRSAVPTRNKLAQKGQRLLTITSLTGGSGANVIEMHALSKSPFFV